MRLLIALLVGLVLPAVAQECVCTGDCDGDGRVRIAELIVGVNAALGRSDVDVCPSFDRDGDGAVRIGELMLGVRNAHHGCERSPGDLLYAAGEDGVTLIESGTGSVRAVYETGPSERIALSADGRTLFVSQRRADDFYVVVVDAATGRVQGEMPAPGRITGMSAEPGGIRLWVAHSIVVEGDRRFGRSGTTVFDLVTYTVAENIDLPRSTVVFAAAGDVGFAVDQSAIVAIDPSTYSIVSRRYSICCVTSRPYLHPGSGLAFALGNEFGGFLAIADFFEPDDFTDVVFLRGQSLEEIDFQYDLAFSPDGRHAYLPGEIASEVSSGALFVVDTADPRLPFLEATIELDFHPSRIALSGDGALAYLRARQTVYVLDLSTLEVVDRIELPTDTSGVVLGEAPDPCEVTELGAGQSGVRRTLERTTRVASRFSTLE